MGFIGEIGGIAGGVIGAFAGGAGGKNTTEYAKNIGPEGELSALGGKSQKSALEEFQKFLSAGPGQSDVQAGTDASRLFANMLMQFSQSGGLPSQGDFDNARSLTNNVFAPQQEQLKQNFADANMQGNRAAARLGRSGNDPILMNKLMQEQTRQQGMLDANKTSFFAQQAQQMPGQRLGYAQQYTQMQNGLASQAMANRQALFSMGSNLRTNEQNFQLNSANQMVNTWGGSSFVGSLAGGLAGAGTGYKAGAAMESGNSGSTTSGGGSKSGSLV